MEDTGMTMERRRILDMHLNVWTRSLELDVVVIYLHAHGVFNDQIIDAIKAESTIAMKRYQCIRQLKMRGNNAFFVFYKALLKSKQIYMADLIASGLNSEERKEINGPTEYRAFVFNPEPFDEKCKYNVCLSPSTEAIQWNRSYYRAYSSVEVREPAGILYDLEVDAVDAPVNLSSFDAELTYPNFTSPRGMALIISNRYFYTMPERIGTDVDEINLNNLFRQLNYAVVVYRNLRSVEMRAAIEDFAKDKRHRNLDSCVVCVLTHGEQGKIFGTDDNPITVVEFVSTLNSRNSPGLARKPKLFFLQACRGQQYDCGFESELDETDGYFDRWISCSSSKTKGSLAKKEIRKSPAEADILVAYATTPGYVSWRNSLKGSWFIQSICQIFAQYAKSNDILSMLTLVNKQVADAFESSPGSFKQMPDHSSRLRKSFYFFPGASVSA
ncbi:unnamed protein product [Thelazia callipaeda]|uniref:CASPASE_P20 domain-containing protein n=1 Tax=Thelazia callipaeda TaxID=103827 RepID=A0A0N5D5X9_THECL|nr:unnamed protein product [Thelazia callipaeda]